MSFRIDQRDPFDSAKIPNLYVKIFDFGLAKSLHPSDAIDGCYKLTADTGSTRYMAPENYFGKPYSETVDVYSFGILLYQIMSLRTPFEGGTLRGFPKMVFEKGAMPVPDTKWPVSTASLMRKCWSANWKERPSMDEVASTLMDEIIAKSVKVNPDTMAVSCNWKERLATAQVANAQADKASANCVDDIADASRQSIASLRFADTAIRNGDGGKLDRSRRPSFCGSAMNNVEKVAQRQDSSKTDFVA